MGLCCWCKLNRRLVMLKGVQFVLVETHCKLKVQYVDVLSLSATSQQGQHSAQPHLHPRLSCV